MIKLSAQVPDDTIGVASLGGRFRKIGRKITVFSQ